MTAYVLIASQSVATVNLVKEATDGRDYQVIPTTSSSLALFLSQKNLPDIILCEGNLADGTGIDLLKETKADPELKSIPFVFLCPSKDLAELSRKTAGLGVDDVIALPIEPGNLLREIIPHVHRRLSTKETREPETPE